MTASCGTEVEEGKRKGSEGGEHLGGRAAWPSSRLHLDVATCEWRHAAGQFILQLLQAAPESSLTHPPGGQTRSAPPTFASAYLHGAHCQRLLASCTAPVLELRARFAPHPRHFQTRPPCPACALQMAFAALDFALELEPVGEELHKAAPIERQQQAEGCSPSAASADTVWVYKHKQQLQQHDDLFSEDDCSRSAGCSYSCGGAAASSSLLELQDDACSAPLAALSSPAALAPTAATRQLPDGTALVASTFLDDLAAKGSLYQYCIRR